MKNKERVPISTVFDIPAASPRISVDERGVPISTVFEVEGQRPWPVPRHISPVVQGWSTLALIGAGILGYMLGSRRSRRRYGPIN